MFADSIMTSAHILLFTAFLHVAYSCEYYEMKVYSGIIVASAAAAAVTVTVMNVLESIQRVQTYAKNCFISLY